MYTSTVTVRASASGKHSRWLALWCIIKEPHTAPIRAGPVRVVELSEKSLNNETRLLEQYIDSLPTMARAWEVDLLYVKFASNFSRGPTWLAENWTLVFVQCSLHGNFINPSGLGWSGGVCSSKKSELLSSTKLRLPNPSPTSKLQVPPNQGHRSVFDIFCDDLLLLVGAWG